MVRRARPRARKKATDALQAEVFKLAPYVPLGEYFQPHSRPQTPSPACSTARFPIFWNVKKG